MDAHLTTNHTIVLANRLALKIIFVLITIAAASTLGYGQTSVYTQFKSKDGLPTNRVYALFQDSMGYMWFGTSNGVARYDGNAFVHLGPDQGLRTSFINRIKEDHEGKVMLMGIVGMAYYHQDSLSFPDVDDYIHGAAIKARFSAYYDVRYDADTLSYILSDRGFFGYRDTSLLPVKGPDNVTHLLRRKEFGVVDFYHDGEFTKVPIDQSKRSWGAHIDFIKVGEERFIIHFGNQLFCYEHGEVQYIRDFPSQINMVTTDREGNLWVCTYKSGAWRLDLKDFKVNREVLLPDKSLTWLLQDHEGALWVSSDEDGVFYFPNVGMTYYKSFNGQDATRVKLMEKHADTLYVGTYQNEIYKVVDDSMQLYRAYDADLRTFRIDRRGDLIVSVHGKGTFRVRDEKMIHSTASGFLYFDPENHCYMTTRVGFTVDDYNSWEHHYKRRITTICERDSNTLILFSGNTPFEYSRVDSSLEQVEDNRFAGRYGFGWMTKLGDTEIYTSHVNCLGFFKGDSMFYLNEEHGLASNYCDDLFVESDSILWVCTNRGVNRVEFPFNPEQRKTTFYGPLQGLISPESKIVSVIKDKVWVATGEGLCSFPRELAPYKSKPKIYLKSVKVNQQELPVQGSFALAPDQNMIRIGYNGVTFRKSDAIRYAYRLVESDTNWTISQDPYALFTALNSGSYTFEVKALGAFPGEESEVRSIQLQIAQHLWEKWWFQPAIALVVILIILLVFRQNTRRTKHRQQLTDELNDLKQQALGGQINPHFIFNALNSIQRFILENDRKSSNKYLSRFAQLMRLVLDHSKERFITLDKELKALEIYLELETLRFKEKMSYEIQVPSDLDAEALTIPPLLLQPLVENAIWHGIMHLDGGSGTVQIRIENAGANYRCIIQDNGVGRKLSQARNQSRSADHQSTGMEVTQKRIALANQLYAENAAFKVVDLKNEVGIGVGTRVELTLPKNEL